MAANTEPWLDVEAPQPRLGWYKDKYTGRVHLSKRSTRKKKFGSTGPRPQKVQWQREDDRAYYEAMYGFSSCWFCRYCSCCCQCYDEPDDITDDNEATAEAQTQSQQEQAQTQEADSRCQSADADAN